MSMIKSSLSLLLLAVAMSWGCGRNQQPASIVFGLSGQCNRPGSFMMQSVPTNVAKIVVRLTDAATGKVIKTLPIQPSALKTGGLGIGDLLPGNYDMDIVACGQDAKPLYGTTIANISVKENTKTRVRAFLPGLDTINCVGGENFTPLVPEFKGEGFSKNGRTAFACAIKNNGKYWVFGGFNSINPGTGNMKAGKTIWEYNPELGLFTQPISPSGETMSLPGPWAAGHCMAMQDGIVLVGGVSQGTLGPVGYPGKQPPVMLKETDTATKTAWIIDAKNNIRAIKLSTGIYPYASITPLDNQTFMACGGMGPRGKAVGTCTIFREKSNKITTLTTITLHTGRYGHSAIRLKNGHQILLVGGFSPDATGMPVELIDTKNTAQTGTKVAANLPWTVFQAAWSITADKGEDILVVGGNHVKPGTPNQIQSVQDKATRMALTASGGLYTLTGIKITDLKVKSDEKTGPWTMNSLATIGIISGQRFMAYGFRSFSYLNDTDCIGTNACMPGAINLLDISDAGIETGKVFMDTTSRLGAAALSLNAGSVLLIGGISAPPYQVANTSVLISRAPVVYTEICSGK